jgi:hypothetical protein
VTWFSSTVLKQLPTDKKKKASVASLPISIDSNLDRPNIFGLKALRPFDYIELDLLTFLKTAESAGLNRGEMHENIIAGLTAKKAIALGVVKPLYCSLFQFSTCFYLNFC